MKLTDLTTDDRSVVVLSELALQLVTVADLRCNKTQRAEVAAWLRTQDDKNCDLIADAIEKMEDH